MARLTANDAREAGRRQGATASVEAQLADKGAPPYIATPKDDGGKYHNRDTWSPIFHRHFDSAAECRFAETVLHPRRVAGEISDLQCQARVDLLNCMHMIVDFRYIEDGRPIWHEFKGAKTGRWVLQRKVWEELGPGEYRVSFADRPDLVIFPVPGPRVICRVLQYLEADYADHRGNRTAIRRMLTDRNNTEGA